MAPYGRASTTVTLLSPQTRVMRHFSVIVPSPILLREFADAGMWRTHLFPHLHNVLSVIVVWSCGCPKEAPAYLVCDGGRTTEKAYAIRGFLLPAACAEPNFAAPYEN